MYNSVLKEVMKYYKETNVGISVMCKIWDKIENDRIQERQIVMSLQNYSIINTLELLKILEVEYVMYKKLVLK